MSLFRTEAADALWPADYFDATRIRLRQELTKLRKNLGPAREILETPEDRILLRSELFDVDVRDFENLFARSDQQRHDEKRTALLEAANLSNDPFMLGEHEPWIEAERNRLKSMRYAVLTELGHLFHDDRDFDEALRFAHMAIEVDRTREDGHVLAMQALGNLGFLADALSQYEELRRLLREQKALPSAEAERIAASLQSISPNQKFSSPRSARPTFSVPAPLDQIFGRSAEIEELRALLNPQRPATRLVTLLGPGGIGKTRLALEAGCFLKDPFRQNVAFVSLTDLREASLIPSATLLSLFPEKHQGKDPLAQLVETLPREPILLILDNVEQLTPAGGVVVRQMLEAKPSLWILCTSRQALQVSGETIVRVGPLATPSMQTPPSDAMNVASVQMFLETARADSNLPHENDPDTIIQIARRLEGIPLAIKLAAARLKSLTPKELLSQIEEGFSVLFNNKLDAPERHRTLARAICETFTALDSELQRSFLKLAVFRGGWTRTSAEVVCGIDNCLEAMEMLLDASLIQVDQDGREIRFGMLETLREFALAELSQEEKLALRNSHARWILNTAKRASSHFATRESSEVFRSLDLERDNIREACHFALQNDLDLAVELGAALGSFWFHRGIGFEALRFYEDLFLRLGDKELKATDVEASLAHAAIAHNIADPNREALLERTIELAQRVGMTREEAMAKSLLSICLLRLPDRTESARLAAEALELISSSGSDMEIAFVKRATALLWAHDGRYDCLALGRELVQTSLDHGAVYFELRAKQFLVFASMIFGETKLGEEMVVGLLELATEIAAVYQIPNIQEALGLLAMARGDYIDALEHLHASANDWRERRVMDQYADLNKSIGLCLIKLGDFDSAKTHVVYAMEYWRSVANLSQFHYCLEVLALLSLERGDGARASKIFAASQEAMRKESFVRPKDHDAFSANLSRQFEAEPSGQCSLDEAIALALGK